MRDGILTKTYGFREQGLQGWNAEGGLAKNVSRRLHNEGFLERDGLYERMTIYGEQGYIWFQRDVILNLFIPTIFPLFAFK